MTFNVAGRELREIGTVIAEGEHEPRITYELVSRGCRFTFQWLSGMSRYFVYCAPDDWWDIFESLERAVTTINLMEQQEDVRSHLRTHTQS